MWVLGGGFSSDETVVGTWYDTGKTAYIKTISGTIPNNSVTENQPYTYFKDNNIYIKEVLGGHIGPYLLPLYVNSTGSNSLTTIIQDHSLVMYTNTPQWANGETWHCTIVYTKS